MANSNEHRGRTFLKEWRKYRGLTQDAAGERIGIDQSTLGRIERAIVPYNQDFLERAALAYGCEPGDFFNNNPLAPDTPRLIYDRLKKAPPEVQDRALAVLEALLKTA